ncbi:signal peptidase II [Streptomyces adustus]|uniref:Signal peptidase II n=1 Tax=Streptomyces adustus TaxID=1609272 RepID=A0A5N8VHI9_9ACTN|nr:signal peptidase II [Streptomyces adustus]
MWAEHTLADGPIEGGPLDLQLAHNLGVAFSAGANAPGWMVLAVTALITTAVAVALWRTAPTARRLWGTALAAILGSAVVTDCLHSGWWPTFNLADVFIVCGGLLLVALSWRTDRPRPAQTWPLNPARRRPSTPAAARRAQGRRPGRPACGRPGTPAPAPCPPRRTDPGPRSRSSASR